MKALNDIDKAFQVETFAIFAVIDFIARILSKCDIKVYKNGKETKQAEWYALNYQPNKNQNAKEFFYEFYSKLLFDSEVLAFYAGTELLIADSFNIHTYVVKEFEFNQIARDSLTFQKENQMRDVIYCKYCNTNIRGLVNGIISKYSETLQAANESYIMSSGKKGILTVDAIAQSKPDYEEHFKKTVNESFRKFFKEKNAVLPLYNGFKYTDISATSDKNSVSKISDMKTLFDEALTRAAQAYQVPPIIFKGEVADTDNATDLLISTCFDPIIKLAETEFTRKKYSQNEIINGCKIKIDTSKIKKVDIFQSAEKIDKLISDGVLCVDEIREHFDYAPCNTEFSKNHYITKNYEKIDTTT